MEKLPLVINLNSLQKDFAKLFYHADQERKVLSIVFLHHTIRKTKSSRNNSRNYPRVNLADTFAMEVLERFGLIQVHFLPIHIRKRDQAC
eukprot:07689.XXX_392484_392753_1 [CDS] Oithona nana genome sequencing.